MRYSIHIVASILFAVSSAAVMAEDSPAEQFEEIKRPAGAITPSDLKEQHGNRLPAVQGKNKAVSPSDLKERRRSGKLPAVQDEAGAVTPSDLKGQSGNRLPAVQDKAGAITPSDLKERRGQLPAVQGKASPKLNKSSPKLNQ